MKKLLIIPLFLFPFSVFALTPPLVFTCYSGGYITINNLTTITPNTEDTYRYNSLDNGWSSFNSNGSVGAIVEGTNGTDCEGKNLSQLSNKLGSNGAIGGGGILFNSPSSPSGLMAAVGEVSGGAFSSLFPYLMLSVGVFVGFYIVQKIVMMFGGMSGEKVKKKK